MRPVQRSIPPSFASLAPFFLLLAFAVPAVAEDLSSTGEFNYYRNNEAFALLPDGPFVSAVTETMREHDPNLGIEARFAVSGALPETWATQRLAIYNILRSISSMEGIEYYSASRGVMREFYLESYTIAGPDSRKPIPDPLVTSIPREETIYVYQRDSSFGRNVQRVTYSADESGFLMEIENLTRMYYNFVPIVGPGKLKIVIMISPSPEGLVFYGNLGVRVPGAFGFEDRVRDSFQNRIIALHNWFTGELAVQIPQL